MRYSPRAGGNPLFQAGAKVFCQINKPDTRLPIWIRPGYLATPADFRSAFRQTEMKIKLCSQRLWLRSHHFHAVLAQHEHDSFNFLPIIRF